MPRIDFDVIACAPASEVNREHQVSFFRNVADKEPRTGTLTEFVERITSPKFGPVIEQLRAEPDAKRQEAMKRRLPCATLSGVFNGGHAMEHLSRHSGLICLDFDAKDNPSIVGKAEEWRDKLSNDEFVKLAFVSVRGNGVAAVVKVEPERHDQAFEALVAYFRGTHGITADKGCRDITRLRFITFDPRAKGNPHARLFKRYKEWTGDDGPPLQQPPAPLDNGTPDSPDTRPLGPPASQPQRPLPERPPASTHALSKARREEILSALEKVIPDERQTWLSVGMAIQSEADNLEGYNLWRRWSEFNDTAGKFNEPDLDRVWRSFGRRHGTNIETLFKLAYANKWQGPPPDTRAAGTLPAMGVDEWMLTNPKPRDPIVENLIDAGTLTEIIAPSKCRKSFFAWQLANCVATGLKFLCWPVPRPRKVMLINVELIPDRAHEREARMLRGLGLQPSALSRFEVVHTIGLKLARPLTEICATISEKRPEICIIDPLYLIHNGEENDQKSMTEVLLELSTAAYSAQCALVIVHHDAKGNAADRDIRDRGSGSGVMGRISATRVILSPHATDPANLSCVETLCRYSLPSKPVTIRFEGGEDERDRSGRMLAGRREGRD